MEKDCLSLAKYVINDCYNKGKYINNLKLQKLLYIIQGKCLSKIGIPAFYDEIYAWKCGVIIHSVYFQFASYASEPILTRYKDYERDFFLKETVDEVISKKY